MWVKGQSGNPGGRPKADQNVQKTREAARRRVGRYLSILDKIAHGRAPGDPARLQVRVRACLICLQIAGVQFVPDQPQATQLDAAGPPPIQLTPAQIATLLGQQRVSEARPG